MLDLEGEVTCKNAKMSSFSSDFQTFSININFLCIFFMNNFIKELEKIIYEISANYQR